MWVLRSELGSSEELSVLQNAEPSLQPLPSLFKFVDYIYKPHLAMVIGVCVMVIGVFA